MPPLRSRFATSVPSSSTRFLLTTDNAPPPELVMYALKKKILGLSIFNKIV